MWILFFKRFFVNFGLVLGLLLSYSCKKQGQQGGGVTVKTEGIFEPVTFEIEGGEDLGEILISSSPRTININVKNNSKYNLTNMSLEYDIYSTAQMRFRPNLSGESISPGYEGTCGNTLAPSESCQYKLYYRPIFSGFLSQKISFNYQNLVGPVSINKEMKVLTGPPASLIFEDEIFEFDYGVVERTNPESQYKRTVKIINAGGVRARSIGISLENLDQGFRIENNLCPETLLPEENCTLDLIFQPPNFLGSANDLDLDYETKILLSYLADPADNGKNLSGRILVNSHTVEAKIAAINLSHTISFFKASVDKKVVGNNRISGFQIINKGHKEAILRRIHIKDNGGNHIATCQKESIDYENDPFTCYKPSSFTNLELFENPFFEIMDTSNCFILSSQILDSDNSNLNNLRTVQGKSLNFAGEVCNFKITMRPSTSLQVPGNFNNWELLIEYDTRFRDQFNPNFIDPTEITPLEGLFQVANSDYIPLAKVHIGKDDSGNTEFLWRSSPIDNIVPNPSDEDLINIPEHNGFNSEDHFLGDLGKISLFAADDNVDNYLSTLRFIISNRGGGSAKILHIKDAPETGNANTITNTLSDFANNSFYIDTIKASSTTDCTLLHGLEDGTQGDTKCSISMKIRPVASDLGGGTGAAKAEEDSRMYDVQETHTHQISGQSVSVNYKRFIVTYRDGAEFEDNFSSSQDLKIPRADQTFEIWIKSRLERKGYLTFKDDFYAENGNFGNMIAGEEDFRDIILKNIGVGNITYITTGNIDYNTSLNAFYLSKDNPPYAFELIQNPSTPLPGDPPDCLNNGSYTDDLTLSHSHIDLTHNLPNFPPASGIYPPNVDGNNTLINPTLPPQQECKIRIQARLKNTYRKNKSLYAYNTPYSEAAWSHEHGIWEYISKTFNEDLLFKYSDGDGIPEPSINYIPDSLGYGSLHKVDGGKIIGMNEIRGEPITNGLYNFSVNYIQHAKLIPLDSLPLNASILYKTGFTLNDLSDGTETISWDGANPNDVPPLFMPNSISLSKGDGYGSYWLKSKSHFESESHFIDGAQTITRGHTQNITNLESTLQSNLADPTAKIQFVLFVGDVLSGTETVSSVIFANKGESPATNISIDKVIGANSVSLLDRDGNNLDANSHILSDIDSSSLNEIPIGENFKFNFRIHPLIDDADGPGNNLNEYENTAVYVINYQSNGTSKRVIFALDFDARLETQHASINISSTPYKIDFTNKGDYESPDYTNPLDPIFDPSHLLTSAKKVHNSNLYDPSIFPTDENPDNTIYFDGTIKSRLFIQQRISIEVANAPIYNLNFSLRRNLNSIDITGDQAEWYPPDADGSFCPSDRECGIKIIPESYSCMDMNKRDPSNQNNPAATDFGATVNAGSSCSFDIRFHPGGPFYYQSQPFYGVFSYQLDPDSSTFHSKVIKINFNANFPAELTPYLITSSDSSPPSFSDILNEDLLIVPGFHEPTLAYQIELPKVELNRDDSAGSPDLPFYRIEKKFSIRNSPQAAPGSFSAIFENYTRYLNNNDADPLNDGTFEYVDENTPAEFIKNIEGITFYVIYKSQTTSPFGVTVLADQFCLYGADQNGALRPLPADGVPPDFSWGFTHEMYIKNGLSCRLVLWYDFDASTIGKNVDNIDLNDSFYNTIDFGNIDIPNDFSIEFWNNKFTGTDYLRFNFFEPTLSPVLPNKVHIDSDPLNTPHLGNIIVTNIDIDQNDKATLTLEWDKFNTTLGESISNWGDLINYKIFYTNDNKSNLDDIYSNFDLDSNSIIDSNLFSSIDSNIGIPWSTHIQTTSPLPQVTLSNLDAGKTYHFKILGIRQSGPEIYTTKLQNNTEPVGSFDIYKKLDYLKWKTAPTNQIERAGETFAQIFEVEAYDVNNNLMALTNNTVTITFHSDDTCSDAGEISTSSWGAYTGNVVTTNSGVARFTNLQFTNSGKYYVRAQAIKPDGNPTSLCTNYKNDIRPNVPNSLSFVAQPSDSPSMSNISSPNGFTVKLVDVYGNRAGYQTNGTNVTISFDSNSFGVGSFLSGTLTRQTTSGLATFDDVKINKMGTYTLKADSNGLPTSSPSNSFVISAGAPAYLGFEFPSSSVTSTIAGDSIPDFKVFIFDGEDNKVSINNFPVTLEIIKPIGQSTTPQFLASGTFPNNINPPDNTNNDNGLTITRFSTSGEVIFSNVIIGVADLEDNTKNYKFIASGNSITPTESNEFEITYSDDYQLSFVFDRMKQTTAGQVIKTNEAPSQFIKVQVLDRFNNKTATDNLNITLLKVAGNGNITSGSSDLTYQGEAIFSNLKIETAGTGYILEATSSPPLLAVQTSTMNPFNIVTTNNVSQLTWNQAPPSTFQAGVVHGSDTKINLLDEYGNQTTVNSVTGLSLEITNDQGTGDSISSTLSSVSSGVATFSNLNITQKVGSNLVLSAKLSSPSYQIDHSAVTVTPGPTTKVDFISTVENVEAGASQTITLKTLDQFDNDSLENNRNIDLTINYTNGSPWTTPNFLDGSDSIIGAGKISATTNSSGVATFSNVKIDIADPSNTYSLKAKSGPITKDSNSFTISHSVNNKLAFLNKNFDSVTVDDFITTDSGTKPVTVIIQDKFGNECFGQSTAYTIHLQKVAPVGGGNIVTPASGDLSLSAGSSQIDFTNLSIQEPEANYQIQVTSTPILISETSNSFNISAGDPTQLSFKTQPSSTQAGTGISFEVEIQDQYNFLAAVDIPVSIRIVPTGTPWKTPEFLGTADPSKITVTSSSGIATFSNVKIDIADPDAPYTIIAETTEPGISSKTSSNFTISHGAADHLEFFRDTISNTSAGNVINDTNGDFVTVVLKDFYGNECISNIANHNIKITKISPSSGSNPLNNTLSIPSSTTLPTIPADRYNSRVAFQDLNIVKSKTGYRLEANSTNTTLGSAQSQTFDITSKNASKIVFSIEPKGAVAGESITDFEIAFLDHFDNPTSDTGTTVTLSIKSASGSPWSTPNFVNASGNSLGTTITTDSSGGLAIFSGVRINIAHASGYYFSATSSVGNNDSASFVISPAANDHIAFKNSNFLDANANDSIKTDTPSSPTLILKDKFNNECLSNNTSYTILLETITENGNLVSPLTNPVISSGSCEVSISDLKIKKTGLYKIQASTNPALPDATPAESSSFNILPLSATKIVFDSTNPSLDGVAGNVLPTFKVQLLDEFDNLTTDTGTSINLSLQYQETPHSIPHFIDSGGTPLVPSPSASSNNGEVTFNNIRIDIAHPTYTLKATNGTLTDSPESDTFSISHTGNHHLVFKNPTFDHTFASSPIKVGAGSEEVTVILKDRFENECTSNSTSYTLNLDTIPAGKISSPGSAPQLSSGSRATISDFKINTAGNDYQLKISSAGLSPDLVSNNFNILPLGPTKLAFTTQPQDTEAGITMSDVIIQLRDSFDNDVTYDNGTPVTLSLNPLGSPWKAPHFIDNNGDPIIVTSNSSNGQVTFNNIKIDIADPSGYTLGATSRNFSDAPFSSSFIIKNSVGDKLEFANELVQLAQEAGKDIISNDMTSELQLLLKDRFGNNCIDNQNTEYTISLKARSPDLVDGGNPEGYLEIDPTTTSTITIPSGAYSTNISGLQITTSGENYYLEAVASPVISTNAFTSIIIPFTINPSTPADFEILTDASDFIADSPMTTPIQLKLKDIYGNYTTNLDSDPGSINISYDTSPPSPSPSNPKSNTSIAVSKGIATIQNLIINTQSQYLNDYSLDISIGSNHQITNSFTVNASKIIPVISRDDGQEAFVNSVTSGKKIIFKVTFNQEVTGFQEGDLAFESTDPYVVPANNKLSLVPTSNPLVYTIEITGLPNEGIVRPYINAGVVSNNPSNLASISQGEYEVRYDKSPPDFKVDTSTNGNWYKSTLALDGTCDSEIETDNLSIQFFKGSTLLDETNCSGGLWSISDIDISSYPEGSSNTITTSVTDLSGNITSVDNIFGRDITPPSTADTILNITNDATYWHSATASWNYSDSLSGISHFEISIGTSPENSDIGEDTAILSVMTSHQAHFTSGGDSPLELNQNYYTTLIAVDNAGNRSAPLLSTPWRFTNWIKLTSAPSSTPITDTKFSIQWDESSTLNNGFFSHSTSSNSEIITVKEKGSYKVHLQAPLQTESTSDGFVYTNFSVLVNGSENVTTKTRIFTSSSDNLRSSSASINTFFWGLSENTELEIEIKNLFNSISNKYTRLSEGATLYIEYLGNNTSTGYPNAPFEPEYLTIASDESINYYIEGDSINWNQTVHRNSGDIILNSDDRFVNIKANGIYLINYSIPLNSNVDNNSSTGFNIRQYLDNWTSSSDYIDRSCLTQSFYKDDPNINALQSGLGFSGFIEVNNITGSWPYTANMIRTISRRNFPIQSSTYHYHDNKSRIFIEKVDPGSINYFQNTDDASSWNSSGERVLMWDDSNSTYKNTELYEFNSNTGEIMFKKSGSYLVTYNDSLETTDSPSSAINNVVSLIYSDSSSNTSSSKYNNINRRAKCMNHYLKDGEKLENSCTMTNFLPEVIAGEKIKVSTKSQNSHNFSVTSKSNAQLIIIKKAD